MLKILHPHQQILQHNYTKSNKQYKQFQLMDLLMQNPQAMLQPIKTELTPFEQVQQIIQSLPSDQRYLIVYPYHYNSKGIYENNKPPYVLLYQQNDLLTFGDLMQKYAEETNQKEKPEFMYFFLDCGLSLKKLQTIKEVKNRLRIDNFDGIKVYFSISHWIIDECCVQYLANTGAIDVHFVLTDLNFSIYIPILGKQSETYKTVTEKLTKEIQSIFGKTINPQTINLSIKQNNEIKLNDKISLKSLSKEDKVQMSFSNGFKLSTPPLLNNSYLIIKGEETNIKPNKLHYDQIKDKKVKDVLSQINPNKKWNDNGLKIGDFILKPEDRFSKADNLLRNTTAHFKNVAGVIINESHIFEAEQENIMKIGGRVDIERIVDVNEPNIQHRRMCDQRIRIRAETTSHPHFQGNLNSVKPILLYTSELKVTSSQGTVTSLFRNLNAFLRNQQFGTTTEKDYKQKWEYSFANELNQELKNIPPITNITKLNPLWRGIKYITNHTVGERILYKQFSSASTIQQQAQSFAYKGLLKITKAFTARSIREYSYFPTESEVLFGPYTEFIVTNVQTIPGTTIPLYELEEIQKTPMPCNKSLFILWVDDKIKEGKQLWGSFKEIQKTTVMKQFETTQEFKLWLEQNKTFLQDGTTEFIMITNMSRVENKKKNSEAGVAAIKQYRKYMKQGHIFVYIGYIPGALEKLKKNNIQIGDQHKLQVSNDQNILRKFLREEGELQ